MTITRRDPLVLDEVPVPGSTTLCLAAVAGFSDDEPDQVAVLARGGTDPDRALLTAMLALSTRRSWPTGRGGAVHWRGIESAMTLGDVVHNTATNAVAWTADRRQVVKAYRVLGADGGEPELLERVGGEPVLPKFLGRLDYVGPAYPERSCLALLTGAVDGVTLDEPLRAALHAHWAGRSTLPTGLTSAVRKSVADLHSQLAQGQRPRLAPLAERLPRFEAMRSAVRETLPVADARHALLDRTATVVRMLVRERRFPAGPAHGDLHLGNVLVGSTSVTFVDPVGRSAHPTSPIDDFAALVRGVECFAADEAISRGAPGAPWATGVVRELTAGIAEADLAVPYLLRTLHELRYHGERAGDPDADLYADLTWISLAEYVAKWEKGTGA